MASLSIFPDENIKMGLASPWLVLCLRIELKCIFSDTRVVCASLNAHMIAVQAQPETAKNKAKALDLSRLPPATQPLNVQNNGAAAQADRSETSALPLQDTDS